MKNQKQRILWADSLKGLLMLLVILGHVIQSIKGDLCFDDHVFNLIYSFHMPAFMAVSGWFAFSKSNTSFINTCKRRIYQLLIPYFIWSLFRWGITDCSINNLSKIILYPDSYYWFLWVLFWICIIFTLCQWVSKKLHFDEFVTIALSCFILMIIMVGLDFRILGFQFLAYYFLFYTLGYSIHRFSFLQIKYKLILLTITFVWLILAWFWKMHELPICLQTIPYIPSTLLQYAYRGLTASIAILVLLGVSPKLLNNDSKFNSYLKDLGIVSLGLYVVHLPIMGYIAKINKAFAPSFPIWCQICIIFVLTCIISTILVVFLNKNKWTAKYLLGKL